MDKKLIIKKTTNYIRSRFADDTTGHDWWHIERVWKIAKSIAAREKNVDVFVVEMAALLHELGDYKLEPDGVDRQKQKVSEYLRKAGIRFNLANEITAIVANMSFSKNIGLRQTLSLEGQIVQDADRLEALGAIGIARVFVYAGQKGNLIYNPAASTKKKISAKSYKKSKSTAIDHFYQKLLRLKYTMNTKTGKKIAAFRHTYLENYLKEFFLEWEGKK